VYNDQVLTESGLVVQFLLDSHPKHLLKASSEPDGALQRYRIGFFLDAYFGNAHPFFDKAVYSTGQDETAAANKYIETVVREIEPLLVDAAPYFGGSKQFTLAEVC
jgi:glutathione S-transferase